MIKLKSLIQEQSGIDMQKALEKVARIDGLSFSSYLKNIKGIATSLVNIGEDLLTSSGGSAPDAAKREQVCAPIRESMLDLAPMTTDLLDRMRQDAESDMIQMGLIQSGTKLGWDDFAALMSQNYKRNKIGLMTIVKPILKAALAAVKLATKGGVSFYVDAAILAMLAVEIKKHCGATAGGTISSVMTDSIASVIKIESTGLTC